MVTDTSAVLAGLTEADGERYLAAMRTADRVAMSAVSVYETRIVLSGRRNGRSRFSNELMSQFDQLLLDLPVDVVPFDRDQAALAHAAYLRFGRGFHPAGLNLADCAAYALARFRAEPLLFKGSDFSQTDVTPAL